MEIDVFDAFFDDKRLPGSKQGSNQPSSIMEASMSMRDDFASAAGNLRKSMTHKAKKFNSLMSSDKILADRLHSVPSVPSDGSE